MGSLSPKFNMTKSLTRYLEAYIPGLDIEAAGILADHILAAAARDIADGHTVDFHDLGKFKPVAGLPRKGRNPRNPTVTIDIPARNRVKFIADQLLLNLCNPTPTNP